MHVRQYLASSPDRLSQNGGGKPHGRTLTEARLGPGPAYSGTARKRERPRGQGLSGRYLPEYKRNRTVDSSADIGLSGDSKVDPLGDSNSDPTPPTVRPPASRSQPAARGEDAVSRGA